MQNRVEKNFKHPTASLIPISPKLGMSFWGYFFILTMYGKKRNRFMNFRNLTKSHKNKRVFTRRSLWGIRKLFIDHHRRHANSSKRTAWDAVLTLFSLLSIHFWITINERGGLDFKKSGFLLWIKMSVPVSNFWLLLSSQP